MPKGKRISFVLLTSVFVLLAFPHFSSAQSESAIKAAMTKINGQVSAMGKTVRLEVVEYYPAGEKQGQIIYFNNRSKQMGSDWVPGDPRRWGGTEIFWISDLVDGTANGVTFGQPQTAISRAMATWNSVRCASIPLIQLPDYGLDWGYVQWLLGLGGVPGWWADFTHAGWLPGTFFEIIGGPGASDYILGVTFTFIWVDGNTGQPTDIDHNNKEDVAFRETYYNNKFPWGINTSYPYDVESIVLHESGHGVSLGHFGKLFQTEVNGKFHFAPRAVMNAGYTGVQQKLSATDIAAFCSVWGSWPRR
jgi:hypothetical protein